MVEVDARGLLQQRAPARGRRRRSGTDESACRRRGGRGRRGLPGDLFGEERRSGSTRARAPGRREGLSERCRNVVTTSRAAPAAPRRGRSSPLDAVGNAGLARALSRLPAGAGTARACPTLDGDLAGDAEEEELACRHCHRAAAGRQRVLTLLPVRERWARELSRVAIGACVLATTSCVDDRGARSRAPCFATPPRWRASAPFAYDNDARPLELLAIMAGGGLPIRRRRRPRPLFAAGGRLPTLTERRHQRRRLFAQRLRAGADGKLAQSFVE